MPNIFNGKDKDGHTVVCSRGWWEKHIINRHPEVADWLAHIQTAIQDPYQVYQDRTNLNRKIYYRPFILPPPFSTQYLRIAIQYKQKITGQITGFIVTAFPCSNIKEGDILIWQRPL